MSCGCSSDTPLAQTRFGCQPASQLAARVILLNSLLRQHKKLLGSQQKTQPPTHQSDTQPEPPHLTHTPPKAGPGGKRAQTSQNCHLVHNREKRPICQPSSAGNSRKTVPVGKPCPQTPLYSLRSQTATIQLAGFRNYTYIPGYLHCMASSVSTRMSQEP